MTEEAKVVLVLLYALRYEKAPNNSIKNLVELLDRYGVSEHASSVRTALVRENAMMGILIPLNHRSVACSCYSYVCWTW